MQKMLAAALLAVLCASAAADAPTPSPEPPPAAAAKGTIPSTKPPPRARNPDRDMTFEQFGARLGTMWKIREGTTTKSAQGLFDELDADGDKLLNGKEMRLMRKYVDTTNSGGARPDGGAPKKQWGTGHMVFGEFIGLYAQWKKDAKLRDGKPPRPMFDGVDVDKNFALDEKELAQLAKNLGFPIERSERPPGSKPPESHESFMKASEKMKQKRDDYKKNGPSQTFQQFNRHAGKRAEELGHDAKEVFEQLDVNNDRTLSREEMRSFRDILNPGNPSKEAEGRGGGLSFAEFERRYIQKLRTDKSPHGHHEAFMDLDTNGDLRLGPVELRGLQPYLARKKSEL